MAGSGAVAFKPSKLTSKRHTATPAGFIALGEVIGAGVATNHGPQPQRVPLPARKDLYPQTTSHRTAEPTGGEKDLRLYSFRTT